ncbi:hypothetical protein BGZ60DRAFT_377950 [Tricladium varicosporioides]|nr:hypothetical protein BGZ60DRAFT_377950 [Hymenoscyphus varicosporioides]
MATSSKKAEDDLAGLKTTVATAFALIEQLQAFTESKEIPNDSIIDALQLASDSASLIRAHTTKLSLLIINKPFTASAINTVLRELVSGPLPGLASAVELCTAARYTKSMSEELQWRVKKLFMEFSTLVKIIPLDGQVLTTDEKNGTGKTVGKGSLANTGIVWEACDAIVELKKMGISGLVIKKADEYRDLLKDALEELQEWGEETADDDEENNEGNTSDNDGEETSAQAAVDAIFGSQRHIPLEDPEKIRPRLESTQKRLRLLILMYQAVVKRRFKTLPHLPHPELPVELKAKSNEDPGIISCLDEVLKVLKKIPDITDELANAFYELDGREVDKRMDECFFSGFAAAELLIKNWEGEQDEFTTWARKFQIAMKKGW